MTFQTPRDRDTYEDAPAECDDFDGVPITRAEAIALARANRARVDSLMRSEVDRDASRADD